MAKFMRMELCDKHPDSVPSKALYMDGSAFCYGCSTYFPSDPALADIEPPENSLAEIIVEAAKFARTVESFEERDAICRAAFGDGLDRLIGAELSREVLIDA